MPSPESGTTPEGGAEFTPPIPLKEARAKVGSERASERTRLRDTEGILDREETVDSKTTSEKYYMSALLAKVEYKAREMKAEGATKAEILSFVADKILDEQLKRQAAEIEARDNPDTKLGKLKSTFMKAWRKYPKTRLAVGLGLTAATGGFAAAGLGGFAIATAGVRAGMSAIGGYMAAKAGQEVAGAKFSRRGEFGRLTPGTEGRLAPLGDTKKEAKEGAKDLTSEERWERMAALLSPDTEKGRTKKQTEGDERTLEALRDRERKELLKDLEKNAVEHARGRHLISGTMKMLDERVSAQLLAERQQLQYDKKLNRRRTFVALAVGAATGTISLVSGLHHSGGGSHPSHPPHHPSHPPHSGGGGGPHPYHPRPPHVGPEAPHGMFADHVKPGQTVWGHTGDHIRVAFDRLHGHGAWRKLGEHGQNAKIAYAVDAMNHDPSQVVPSGDLNLIRPGQTIRISKSIIEAAARYK
jgi:hypothetical protein